MRALDARIQKIRGSSAQEKGNMRTSTRNGKTGAHTKTSGKETRSERGQQEEMDTQRKAKVMRVKLDGREQK